MTGPTELVTSFEDAYDSCFVVAYQAAFHIVAIRGDAEDIAQEAMVRAYTRWSQVSSHAEPWVTRVATNLALDAVRRRNRRMPFSSANADAAVDERLDLAVAVARLPKRQREAVALRYIADLPEADVARLMGCSAGTVKQHASRGLAALRGSGHLGDEYS